MKHLLLFCIILLSCTVMQAQTNNFHSFKAKDIDGKEISMSQFKGKKVLVVNVASECGNTPQYEQLQQLYDRYGPDKFVVIGFPANNFGEQEPGSNAEIKQFCSTHYKITFPMMSKISVTGDDIDPIYRWLTSKSENGVMDAPVTWNFQKFMIDENGNLVGMMKPKEEPRSTSVINWITE